MRNDTPLVGRLRAHAGFVENGGCADHSMTDEAAIISEAIDRIEKLEAALWDAEMNLDPEHETKWYAAYKDLLAEIRNRAALNGE